MLIAYLLAHYLNRLIACARLPGTSTALYVLAGASKTPSHAVHLLADVFAAQPFERLDLQLRTNAGSSRKVLGSQLGDLFARCGLPSEFEWDEKYVVTPLWKRDEFQPSADEKRADENAAQKKIQDLLVKMDPVGQLASSNVQRILGIGAQCSLGAMANLWGVGDITFA